MADLSRWRGEHMRLKYSVLLLPIYLAGAGNTRGNRRGFSRKAIYPRWRGNTDRHFAVIVYSAIYLAGAGNTLSIHNCF